MITLNRGRLENKAQFRPAGYIEDIEASGVVLENGDVVLTDEVYKALRIKYSKIVQGAVDKMWQEFEQEASADSLDKEKVSNYGQLIDILNAYPCPKFWFIVVANNKLPQTNQTEWLKNVRQQTQQLIDKQKKV